MVVSNKGKAWLRFTGSPSEGSLRVTRTCRVGGMGGIPSALVNWTRQDDLEKPASDNEEKKEGWLEYLASFFKSRIEDQNLGRNPNNGGLGEEHDEDRGGVPPPTHLPNNAEQVGAAKELDGGEEETGANEEVGEGHEEGGIGEDFERDDDQDSWEEWNLESGSQIGADGDEDGEVNNGNDAAEDEEKAELKADEKKQVDAEHTHKQEGKEGEKEEEKEEGKVEDGDGEEVKKEHKTKRVTFAEDEHGVEKSSDEVTEESRLAANVEEKTAEEEKEEDKVENVNQDTPPKRGTSILKNLGLMKRRQRPEEVVLTEVEEETGEEGDLEEGRFKPKPPTQPKSAVQEGPVEVEIEGRENGEEDLEKGVTKDEKDSSTDEVPRKSGASGICTCLPVVFGGTSSGATQTAVDNDAGMQKMQEEIANSVAGQSVQVNRLEAPGGLDEFLSEYFERGETVNPEEGAEATVDSKVEPQKRGELKRHLFYFINTVHLFGIVSLNPYIFDGELIGFARVLLMDASQLFEAVAFKEGFAWSFVLFFWLYYGYLTILRCIHHTSEDWYNVHHIWNLFAGLGLIGLSVYLFLSVGGCDEEDKDCIAAKMYYGGVVLIFPIFVFLVWSYFCFKSHRLYGCLGCRRCCTDKNGKSRLYNPLDQTDYTDIKQHLHCWTVATYQVMTYVLFAATTVAFAEVFDGGSTAQQAGACFGIGFYIALIWLLTIEPNFSAQFQDAVQFYKPLFKEREMCRLTVWYLFYIFIFLLEKIILVWLVVTLGSDGDDSGRDAGIGCAVVIVLWTIFTLFIPYNVDDDKSRACWSVFCGEGQEMQLNGRFLDVAGRIVTLCYIGFALASAQADAALTPLFKTLSCLFFLGLFAFWFRYLVAINVRKFCSYDISKSLEIKVDSSSNRDETGGSSGEEASGDDTKAENAENAGDSDEKEGEGEGEGEGEAQEKANENENENAETAGNGDGGNAEVEEEQKAAAKAISL